MIKKKYIYLLFIILFNFYNYSFANDLLTKNSFLSADTIEYHDEISLMSAVGNVEIINGPNILQADRIS